MKSFHQFREAASEVGVRSASTSGTIGGDSGFQARQQQGVNKLVKKGADLLFGKGGKGKKGKQKTVTKTTTTAAKPTKPAQPEVEKKPESKAPDTVKKDTKVKQAPVAKKEPTKALPASVKKVEVKDVSDKKPAAQKALPAAKKAESNPQKKGKPSLDDLLSKIRSEKGESKKKMVKKPEAKKEVKALPPATKALPAAEAYDPEVAGRSQIRKQGEGGRIGAERKKSEPERRRMKAVGGGKTAPVGYKDRKDIGQQRQRSTREQQPTKERGSAASAQAAAAKEARKAAARARIAAKKAGGTHKAGVTKTSGKDAEKQATKLLSTKKPEKKVSSDYKQQKASGMTRSERMSQQRKGEAVLKDIMKKQETDKYKKETGQNPDRKGKTKILGRVAKRMAN
jgi:colicin import membrane protein